MTDTSLHLLHKAYQSFWYIYKKKWDFFSTPFIVDVLCVRCCTLKLSREIVSHTNTLNLFYFIFEKKKCLALFLRANFRNWKIKQILFSLKEFFFWSRSSQQRECKFCTFLATFDLLLKIFLFLRVLDFFSLFFLSPFFFQNFNE